MKKYSWLFLLFFILIGLGYLISFESLDPDFGWHLRTGQLILERGVPKVDWYSFTMPDFPWIDHEWLTEVLIYLIYSIFGFQILLLFFLAILSLSFLILIKPENFRFYLLPVLLGFLATLGFLGIRPQIITIFFIAIFWKILIEFFDDKKLGQIGVLFFPSLFFIWANLHGGFLAGLFILSLFIFLEIFKKTTLFKKLISFSFFREQNFKERENKKTLLLFFILIFSFLATFFNPYGIRIYQEIFRTIGDNFLRFHIFEWLPLFFADPSIFILSYLALFLGVLIPLRKKIEFNELVLVIFFLIFSLLNQRHFFYFCHLNLVHFCQTFIFLISRN